MIKGYCKKHWNHECLAIVMMYHVSSKFLKKKEFTPEVGLFSFFREFQHLLVVYYGATQHTFRPKLEKVKKSTPKKIPYISGNGNFIKASYILGNGTFQAAPRNFLIFQEMETPKKSLYFRKSNFLIFQEQNFLIAWERYIQNPSIFRTRSIFKTVVYSDPWHIQNQKHIQNPRHIQNTIKHLGWNVWQKQLPRALFGLSPQKFPLKNFLYFLKRKLSLYFRK